MIKVYTMQQSTPEWFKARAGIPTSSCFHRIMTPKGMTLASGARTYARELIAGMVPSDRPIESYTNPAIEHGIETENEARSHYAQWHTDDKVTEVGFCETDDGRFGGSPDGMVGEDGVLEIKCPQPNTHVAWLDEDVLPSKHAAQVHGHLLVTGREWCDFISYCPGLPELVVRTYPSEYTERLQEVLNEFHEMYCELKAKPCFRHLFEKE